MSNRKVTPDRTVRYGDVTVDTGRNEGDMVRLSVAAMQAEGKDITSILGLTPLQMLALSDALAAVIDWSD